LSSPGGKVPLEVTKMLKVTVEGHAGEGRTSLAITVAHALAELGMGVEVDGIDIGPEDDLREQAKVAGMAADRARGRKVKVVSVQLPREDDAEA